MTPETTVTDRELLEAIAYNLRRQRDVMGEQAQLNSETNLIAIGVLTVSFSLLVLIAGLYISGRLKIQ